MKDVIKAIAVAVLVALFYVVLYYGKVIQLARKAYFTLFRIPYYTMPDKFYPYYIRKRSVIE